MDSEYLDVPATSVSHERFFSRVGFGKTDLRERLQDTTMIDLMWARIPEIILKEIKEEDTHSHTHTLPTHSLTRPYIYTLSLVSHTPIH